jgi:predicted transcriptional regulator
VTETLVPSSRQTLRSELLHLIEDHTLVGQSASVKDLVACTEKSDSTVRKAVLGLLTDGFITVVPGETPTRYVAVRKSDEPPEEVKNMATTKTKKSAAPSASASEPKPKNGVGRPKDPEVQRRDERVLELIKKDGASVAQIAEKLGVSTGIAYLSVWRLRKAGVVQKQVTGSRTPIWVHVA